MISKNIVLVESHYRSRSWFLSLKKVGLQYIISVNPGEFKRFLDYGFEKNKILNLFFNKKNKIKNKKYFKKNIYYEKLLNINFNSIINTDRTLRLKEKKYIDAYINFLNNEIYNFFKNNHPTHIIIEPTWTHELIICEFAKVFNCKIIAPWKDKLLPNIFLAFKDEKICDFHVALNKLDGKQLAIDALKSVRENNKVPYFDQVKDRNSIDLKRLEKLFWLIKMSIHSYRNPNIHLTLFDDIIYKVSCMIKSFFLRFSSQFIKLKDINKKFILITLHLQPEATIDVIGKMYDNQIDYVRKISDTVPSDYLIIVKEHPHALGNRPINFYNKMLEISNVYLLHPYEDSRNAIKKSELVISNTGTSSLEAVILGVPALTATKMYFHNLMLKEDLDLNVDNIGNIMKKKKNISDKLLISELTKIYENSFKGNCNEFFTDKRIMSKSNLNTLGNSFLDLTS